MGFNQTYLTINRAWESDFESQVPERERGYVLSRMKKLQTAFQNELYQEAIATTKILFGYFSRIASNQDNPLRVHASKMANRFWNLEAILSKQKIK